MSPHVIHSFHNGGKLPSLCLEPSKPKSKFLSLGQWQMAFNTFVAVYTVKYLLKVAALLKYCEIVRDIANKSGNWRYYNQQFRYLRQTNPEKFPWDRVMWELWNQAIHVTSKSPPDNTQNKKPQARPFLSFPKGVCWKFHSGKFCAGYRFKHTCFKCGPMHPVTQCHAKLSVSHASSSGQDRKGSPRLNCGPTPVTPHRLEPLLRGYDPAITTYLVNDFRFGFSIQYFGNKFNFRSKNLKSALKTHGKLLITLIRRYCQDE